MGSKLLVDWIKTLGSIEISWPVVGMTAIIIFRRPLLNIINQLS